LIDAHRTAGDEMHLAEVTAELLASLSNNEIRDDDAGSPGKKVPAGHARRQDPD